uniref:C3H1-type domain-containing protein n=1 Tax=Corethron hystrix TaxID=216773 RepID=A0A6U5LIP5_9STRA|mmetsp:Transcript_5483/g.11324  ORF Transcript_5483/g.11324 Transcript_5483/m.11324 type:complete len:453 (+) Transcript_5483:157-1515(+)
MSRHFNGNQFGGRGGERGRHRGRGDRGRGYQGGRKVDDASAPAPLLTPCKSFTLNGSCDRRGCKFAHCVTRLFCLDAASPKKQDNSNGGGYGHRRNYGGDKQFDPISCMAIWSEAPPAAVPPVPGAPPEQIKLFSGCHDGTWRLWDSAASFRKQFENEMGGRVGALVVSNNLLFCGFEKECPLLPGVKVGSIHAWNLQNAASPPQEFHAEDSAVHPYAHGRIVTSLLPVPDGAGGVAVVSSSEDGLIRVWRFDTGTGKFMVFRSLMGHARAVSGLAYSEGLLWSGSEDHSIRMWDMSKGSCGKVIAGGSEGHSGPVTSLLAWGSEKLGAFVFSSSLDGTIKAWDPAGKMLKMESHGDGVMTIVTTTDEAGNPLLVCGLERGNIMVRSLPGAGDLPALTLLIKLSDQYTCSHTNGPVRCVQAGAGPAGIFYSSGDDGKLMVWQFKGNLAQLSK